MNKFTTLKNLKNVFYLEGVVGPRFVRKTTINQNKRAINKKGEKWKILR